MTDTSQNPQKSGCEADVAYRFWHIIQQKTLEERKQALDLLAECVEAARGHRQMKD